MSEAEKKANESMLAYQDAYLEFNGKPAPKMQYFGGWVLISCSPEVMRFPVRKRRKDLDAMTKTLNLRIKYASIRDQDKRD